MSYLVDTNVISELRKGPRCDALVARWFAQLPDDDLFLSVLTAGEIWRGIASIRRRDAAAGASLERWLRTLLANYAGRILPVDITVAREWGRLNVPNPLPLVDGLIAATATVHDLVLVTRKVKDFERTDVAVFNPFSPHP